ncbi:mechanosensitive ion channel family protein [Methanofollis aquaemaris]|uniref:Mechanosensitive ion channel family protein n=1 Tax=Methanofollis aquaemaris TaxID=126734 RepID=A0A8A3S314_9EURY|nr:mechanosensitive ion channel family protein [Methanofollis aquaemaris]QSZ66303.1 mechanosensitive ion channel family protein [Methanofollis aquaemaris]
MGNALYAILLLFTGLIGSVIIYWVYRLLLKRAERTESKIDDLLVAAMGKPLVITVFVVSIYFSVLYSDLIPARYDYILASEYLNAFYIIIGAWVASSFSYNFIHLYGGWMSARTESEVDDRIIEVLEVVVKYVIWFIAFLLILSTLQIDITPLLAGAGIAGVAVAMAAQDILSNFFGGALIVMDKPFQVRDRIKIDGYLGDVVSIGPRSTRIQTLDYQLVTIPNSMVANSVITNYALPETRLKIKIPVSVAYGTDVKRVKEILLEIADEAVERSAAVLRYPAPSVYFLEFADSSLNFVLIVWAKAFNMSWEVQDFINTRIDERFGEEGIEIPFPQMDVHLRKD